MHSEFMRKQIESSVADAARTRLASRLSVACWPGGGADHTNPAALAWVSRWRPERCGIELLACRCYAGHCEVCN
jgi:hypothetical protein